MLQFRHMISHVICGYDIRESTYDYKNPVYDVAVQTYDFTLQVWSVRGCGYGIRESTYDFANPVYVVAVRTYDFTRLVCLSEVDLDFEKIKTCDRLKNNAAVPSHFL